MKTYAVKFKNGTRYFGKTIDGIHWVTNGKWAAQFTPGDRNSLVELKEELAIAAFAKGKDWSFDYSGFVEECNANLEGILKQASKAEVAINPTGLSFNYDGIDAAVFQFGEVFWLVNREIIPSLSAFGTDNKSQIVFKDGEGIIRAIVMPVEPEPFNQRLKALGLVLAKSALNGKGGN